MVRYCAAEPAWWADTPRASFPPDACRRAARSAAAIASDWTCITARSPDCARFRPASASALRLCARCSMSRSVLLLDEPTGAARSAKRAPRGGIAQVSAHVGRSAVLVSHDDDAGRAPRARSPASAAHGGGGANAAGAQAAMTLRAIDAARIDAGGLPAAHANGAISWVFRLRLEKSIAIAAVRMLVQLALVALVLKFIFAQSSRLDASSWRLVMVICRGRRGRLAAAAGAWPAGAALPSAVATLLFIGMTITVLGVGVMISARSLVFAALRAADPRHGARQHDDGHRPGARRFNEAASRERTAIEARLALGSHRFQAMSGPLPRRAAHGNDADPQFHGDDRPRRPSRHDDRTDPRRRRSRSTPPNIRC